MEKSMQEYTVTFGKRREQKIRIQLPIYTGTVRVNLKVHCVSGTYQGICMVALTIVGLVLQITAIVTSMLKSLLPGVDMIGDVQTTSLPDGKAFSFILKGSPESPITPDALASIIQAVADILNMVPFVATLEYSVDQIFYDIILSGVYVPEEAKWNTSVMVRGIMTNASNVKVNAKAVLWVDGQEVETVFVSLIPQQFTDFKLFYTQPEKRASGILFLRSDTGLDFSPYPFTVTTIGGPPGQGKIISSQFPESARAETTVSGTFVIKNLGGTDTFRGMVAGKPTNSFTLIKNEEKELEATITMPSKTDAIFALSAQRLRVTEWVNDDTISVTILNQGLSNKMLAVFGGAFTAFAGLATWAASKLRRT